MLKVTNGVNVFDVTNGAFEMNFKDMGYHVVGLESDREHVDVSDKHDDDEVDEVEVDLMEKPIGQWSKAELSEFAKENGIDISNAKKVSEVRSIVKDFIDMAEAE